tara:strand:- start:4379 stop:5026 length:648 start_codon:yes stop_codon:yes gene_type:complete
MKIWKFTALALCFFLTFRVLYANDPIYFSASLYEKISQTYGNSAKRRVQKWEGLLTSLKSDGIDDQLYEVNAFFNAIPYYSDAKHWGKSDYWATPVEVLGTNGADCEDYVIAKYYTLRGLGVPDDKLRMMFVTALEYNQAHMVLAYYPEPNAIPFILDNINQRILPANKRQDLRPVYSFNGEGLWMAKAQGRGTQVGNSRHKMWDDLTTRIERDF